MFTGGSRKNRSECAGGPPLTANDFANIRLGNMQFKLNRIARMIVPDMHFIRGIYE